MPWRDAISEGFPSPDEREPANLRSDIIDELADHLACAMNRELRRTDDATAAERAVLERFGNPKAIARQLWWAAMKERIMKDRVFTVVLMVGVLAIIGFATLFFVTQQRRIDEGILARLEALATIPPKQTTGTDNSGYIKVRIVDENANGKPVAGKTVELMGPAFPPSQSHLTEKTNQNGDLSFGPIGQGPYNIRIQDNMMLLVESMTLYGGQERQIVIVRPSPERWSDISMQVPDLSGLSEEAVVVCLFSPEPIQQADNRWEIMGESREAIGIDAKGQLMPVKQIVSSNVWEVGAPPRHTVHWPPTTYKLTKLELIVLEKPRGSGLPQWYSRVRLASPELATYEATPGKCAWNIQLPPIFIDQSRREIEQIQAEAKHRESAATQPQNAVPGAEETRIARPARPRGVGIDKDTAAQLQREKVLGTDKTTATQPR